MDFYPVIQGMFSFPIDLPWTIYGKATRVRVFLSCKLLDVIRHLDVAALFPLQDRRDLCFLNLLFGFAGKTSLYREAAHVALAVQPHVRVFGYRRHGREL